MKDQKINPKDKERLDSLFESYSLIADDKYVFLCDMKYDYSRWSKELVDTFGLPSEYMYSAGRIWEEHIHPEDRRAYHEGIEAIFSGKQASLRRRLRSHYLSRDRHNRRGRPTCIFRRCYKESQSEGSYR